MTRPTKHILDEVRGWISSILARREEPYGEELDLLDEQELIAAREASSDARRWASLVAGAQRLLTQGYPRYVVSIIYGNAVTREAEGLLAPAEWDAATQAMLSLSSQLRDTESLESESVR
jgi:hypothetical protein